MARDSRTPQTAAQNDDAYQNAVGQRMIAQGMGDAKAAAHWQAVIDQLTSKTKGKGLLAKLMSGGAE